MTEFQEDNPEAFDNSSHYVSSGEFWFENIDQVARTLEMLKRRITAGKFVDGNFQGEYRMYHPQQIHEELKDIIEGLRNTEKRFKLTELGT
jgi:hypothetical protein